MPNIYLLTQRINEGYDKNGFQRFDYYDSCIVVAFNEDEARKISPDPDDDGDDRRAENWVTLDQAHLIEVTPVGIASEGLKSGDIILASYNTI